VSCRAASDALFCVEAKRAVIIFVANPLHQHQQDNLEDKRVRHDKAHKDYQQQLRDTSDNVEVYYVKEAERIKESLSAIDGDVKSVFEELDKDEILEMQDHSYVLEMWEKVRSEL